jgi:methionyl aminopeptidase
MHTTQTAPSIKPSANAACWCGSGQKYKKCHRDVDGLTADRPREPRRARQGRVGPMRSVPDHIPRPPYAATGMVPPLPPSENLVLSPERIARMRRACKAAAEVLAEVSAAVKPGITTDALDAIAHEAYIRRGGYPSTLNYHRYPKSMCTSANDIICHGIPDDEPLHDADIVNLDVTIFLGGVHGDCSATVPVGTISEEARRLTDAAHACMMAGIEAVKPGRPIRDVGRAIQQLATRFGMGTVRAFCGHGIHERFHTTLQVPHFDDPEATTIMKPGMVFTVEPMITLGTHRHKEWNNGWTAVTSDGRWTAQFEHTILVTETGAEILTRV